VVKNKELALRTSVQDHLRNEAKEEEFEDVEREVEACPVMAVFKDLETVSFKLNIAVEVQCLECVDWYLVASFVFLPVRFVEEVQVGVNGSAGEFGFFVLAGRET
jgi:hypothetical protein